jgi:hypothetical protein
MVSPDVAHTAPFACLPKVPAEKFINPYFILSGASVHVPARLMKLSGTNKDGNCLSSDVVSIALPWPTS